MVKEMMFNSLPEMLRKSAEKYQNSTALAMVDGVSYTYGELDKLAENIATKIYGTGLKKGDAAAIIGPNSPHWAAAYFGIQRAGGTVVPILTDFSENEMVSILEHSGAEILFSSAKELLKFEKGLPASIKIIVTLEDLKIHDAGKLSELKKGNELPIQKISPNEEQKAPSFPKISSEDLAVILYTSGTTGRSKGVMLTHDNIVFDAVQTGTIHQVVSDDLFLSVLPLAHTYESTIGMVIPLMNGASVYYIDKAPSASYLGPVLAKLRPTTMLTVPLIMDKIYRVKIKPGIQKSPVTRAMSKFGPTRKIVHRGAGKKLMTFFGGRIHFFGIGGAAVAPDVEKFLIEAGFPYAVGYGLTETAPMLAGFGPKDPVYRSVGKPMEGVEIKIHDKNPETGMGEIVARGRNVMKGYYKNEEATREVFTEDGFFRTGDLGMFDEDGILYIKGRSKNMILGANGENIYPEEIESVINEQEFVSESLVLNAKGKMVARVHLNMEQLEEKFQHLIESAKDKQKALHDKAEQTLKDMQESVNQRISKASRLHVFKLQKEPFIKTPTLKIKRFLYKD